MSLPDNTFGASGTPRDRLNSYVAEVEKRLRKGAVLRGAAIVASSALIATILLVLITNHFAFSRGSLTGARALLLVTLVCAAGFGLYLPLSQLGRRNAAVRAESAFAQFQQRLVTFVERDKQGDPFIELLAADALERTRGAEPEQFVPDNKLMALLGVGIASFGVLIWMIAAGPGYLGYGASLLWTGAHAGRSALYDIKVTPGNASVRRNSDQMVTAEPVGIQAEKVRLYARYQSASKWEEVTMQPEAGSSGFQFLFAGLPEGVEYYVEAGPVQSKHFTLRVTDQAVVKQIRVTYRYPAWTAMPVAVEEHGGDLRAVAGTQADLEIQMDRPLNNGMLALDDGQQIQLSGGQGNRYRATVKMERDGAYHVATVDQGQPVRLSEDFFIEANKANPPVIEVDRPARDYRSSPIEEVTISVKGADDYGLNDMALHYSVNGGPDQTVNLLKAKGAKQADGSTTLYMENFKVVPGDLVSLYATAKDANAESHTDIYFVQVDPFEREFSQSQSGAGGGGGGGGGGQSDQADISQREKEIIAATWKQQTNPNASAQQAADQSKFLSGVQTKLREQALSLSGRLQSRDLTEQNQEFNDFQRDMNSAAEAMSPASDKLKVQQWHDAIPAEQKALQYLLRAEATFRQIQVAFGQNGGGGGAGGGAGRDLASLFDLELDTEKNQYETAQTASPADQKAKDIDDAMKKLDDLARREEELAQQRNGSDQTFQQRWQQEMLRREAEELQKQIEQMAKNGQQGSNGASSSGSSGSSGSQSSSGSDSASDGSSGSAGGSQGESSGSSDPRVQQALNQLRQANEDMRRAASQQKSDADAREAANRLRQATDLLGATQQQQNSGKLDSISQEADRIASEERDQADRMHKLGGGRDSMQFGGDSNGLGYGGSQAQSRGSYGDMQKMADQRQQLADSVSQIEKQMRDAARQLDSNQHNASSKLRDALGDMEQSDVETRIQRSADWLRRGINPNANSNEEEVASELQKLSDQVKQAQQALGSGSDQQQDSNTDAALDRVERLRDQLQALDPAHGGRNGQASQRSSQGQPGQAGSRQGNLNSNSLSRGSQSGQGAQSGSSNGQSGGQSGQAGGQGNQSAQLGARGGADNGGGRIGGENYGGNVAGGGDRDRNDRGGWWGFDTGNNSNLPQPVSPDASALPPDPERTYQQSLRELNQLHQTVQKDPEIDRQVQELIDEMQHLDPSRFPGNPALVEQLHTQVLNDVDKLELQLRRQQDDKGTGQIRGGDPVTVPSGYQDAVAEYFRRLSKNQQ